MKKRLCFAAGDVGGARAILPVARLAARQGHIVLGLDHGVFRAEGDGDWYWLNHAQTLTAEFDTLIYATSVTDPLAFQTALSARARGFPIIHVLDNWSQYGARMRGPDLSGMPCDLIPDVYCVMDTLARDEAVAAGVPEGILQVTGHPGLASLADEQATFQEIDECGAHIFFVSEPVVADSGERSDSKGRGYDELEVSGLFAEALAVQPEARSVLVLVAPHPREDRDVVAARWADLAQTHGVTCQIVPCDGVRSALQTARAVVGMSSLLLYEAWLLGHPTLSLQPNLRMAQLAQLGKRDGLQLCTNPTEVRSAVLRLLAAKGPTGTGHHDMALHKNAASAVLLYTK